MEVLELIEKIRKSWESVGELQKLLLDLVELHQKTAQDLGSVISLLSQTFISEKENGYQMTIAEAEHRAKALTGGRHETLRGQLSSLQILHSIVSQRVNDLSSSSKTKGL